MFQAGKTWIEPHHRLQFDTNGYMVLRYVVPLNLVDSPARDITAFVGADLNDVSTWYEGPPEIDGLIRLHQPQSLWNIRQPPTMHKMFTEFFATRELLVDINQRVPASGSQAAAEPQPGLPQ